MCLLCALQHPFSSPKSGSSTKAFELNQRIHNCPHRSPCSLTQPLEGTHFSLHLDHRTSISAVFVIAHRPVVLVSTGCPAPKWAFLKCSCIGYRAPNKRTREFLGIHFTRRKWVEIRAPSGLLVPLLPDS